MLQLWAGLAAQDAVTLAQLLISKLQMQMINGYMMHIVYR